MWGKIVSSVSNVLDFNQATLSGCIDIICVESEIEKKYKREKNENDNTEDKTEFIYKSTPFHVRFGKTKLLRSKEKIVNILVNGKNTNLCMKLGSAGEAYFVEKTYEDVEEELETSPLASPRNELSDARYNETFENMFHETANSQYTQMMPTEMNSNTSDLEKKAEKRKKKKKKKKDYTEKSPLEKTKERKNRKEKKKKHEHVIRQLSGRQNDNSEWSWSWGRFPQLKNNEYNSDNCRILSSHKKEKKKKKKLEKGFWKSESDKGNLISMERENQFKKTMCYDINPLWKEKIKKAKNEKETGKDKEKTENKGDVKMETETKTKEQNKNLEDKNMITNSKNVETEKKVFNETDEDMNKKFIFKRDSLKLDFNKLQKTKNSRKKEMEKQTNSLSPKHVKEECTSSGSSQSVESTSSHDGSSEASYVTSSSSSHSSSSYKKKKDNKQEKSPDTEYFDDDIQNRIDCSLCGHLLINQSMDSKYHDYNIELHNKNIFEANIVTYEQIDNNSSLWYHPSLVFRFDRKEPYYPSRVALPLLASWVVFNQPISISAVEKLLNSSLNLTETKDKRWIKWFGVSNADYDKGSNRNVSKDGKTRNENGKNSRKGSTSGKDNLNSKECISVEETEKKLKTNSESCNNTVNNNINISTNNNQTKNNINTSSTTTNIVPKNIIQNNNLTIVNSEQANNNTNQNSDNNSIRNSSVNNSNYNKDIYKEDLTFKEKVTQRNVTPKERSKKNGRKGEEKAKIRYRKSLRPTSEQLQSLNLKEGANTITFLVTSSLQGTKSINGTIYLWKKNSKIVISDVDGTITRSTVLGHIMPIVGKDWSHVGVAQLFSKIHNNGYHILYLTARAIGQADSTREYLFRLKKNDNNKLPDGPLILSPDRLFPSFKREVIDKKPYIFKIAALRDIKNLFPFNHNPFYAAFGNTESDHRAYISVGVPEAKVFIIDNKGIVHHVNSTYAKTYETMSEITEHMFPCIRNDNKREDDDQVKLKKNVKK